MLAFFRLYKNQEMNLSLLPSFQDEIYIHFYSHPEAEQEEKDSSIMLKLKPNLTGFWNLCGNHLIFVRERKQETEGGRDPPTSVLPLPHLAC